MKQLVLASTSRYRHELLSRLAVPFTAIAHRVDEAAIQTQFANVERGPVAPAQTDSRESRLAITLAREKALSVRKVHPDAWIIGSDQLVAFQGKVLGKPGDHARAHAQLQRLSGHTHALCTATVLARPDGSVAECIDIHQMTMRDLSPSEIDHYLAMDTPFDCAGSYKIERSGICLFRQIDGEDFTAITGLPLLAVTRLLLEEGFEVPGSPLPAEAPVVDSPCD